MFGVEKNLIKNSKKTIKENNIKCILLDQLGEDLYDLLINNNAILAGGALTSILINKPINDYDLYFYNKDDINNLLNIINKDNNFSLINETNNAYTYDYMLMRKIDNIKCKGRRIVIQIIFNPEFMGLSPQDLINTFDFSVCQVAYDFKNNKFYYGNNFDKDIREREIHFNISSNHPIVSFMRVEKYKEKEFNIRSIEILKIIFKIKSLKFKTYKDVINQISGISSSYFMELTNFLSNENMINKPFNDEYFLELLNNYDDMKEILNELSS